MAEYVRPTAQDLTDLATILASADWTAPKLHLSKANFTPTRISVLTDYNAAEADFDGYAAVTVVFGAPHVTPTGKVVAIGLVNFLATGGTTPNALYTVFLTNTAGSKLLCGSTLDGSPININQAGDGTSQIITIGLAEGTIETV